MNVSMSAYMNIPMVLRLAGLKGFVVVVVVAVH